VRYFQAIASITTQLVAMKVSTRYVIEAGDLAILSNEWTLTTAGEFMSAITAEVAQRQPDGGWLYVIDNPYAGPTADAETEAPAAPK
jgi:ketosteroid isomerase-like protein